MKYRHLGNSGLGVSEIGLGANSFGEPGRRDAKQSAALIDAAIDHGINFVDTSNVYAQGLSEEYIGGSRRAASGGRHKARPLTVGPGPYGDNCIRDRSRCRGVVARACDAYNHLGDDPTPGGGVYSPRRSWGGSLENPLQVNSLRTVSVRISPRRHARRVPSARGRRLAPIAPP